MANKRMFAKSIIDSDAFLDMPLSTQALYFHLNMRADDDGFINNPKKIQRMVGCSDDDLKVLIAKRFVITFESGVIVIKHWRIHNTIQKDRYTPTVYDEEKALLKEKPNRAYTLDTECIQNVSTLEAQNRIDKNREDKEREDKRREDDEKPEHFEAICSAIGGFYNERCLTMDRVRTITEDRYDLLREGLKTYTPDDYKELFDKASQSKFLRGEVTKFKANFNWLITPKNMAKVLEGNYDDREEPKPKLNGADELEESYEMYQNWAKKAMAERLQAEAEAERLKNEKGETGEN